MSVFFLFEFFFPGSLCGLYKETFSDRVHAKYMLLRQVLLNEQKFVVFASFQRFS